MFARIFAAIGRALSAAGKCGYYAWLFAEEFVSFPFRLFGLGGYSPQRQAERAEAAALQQKQSVDAENTKLENDLRSKPAQSQHINDAPEVAVLDAPDIKAYLVHLFADCIVYGRPTPDLDGLDFRTRIWCEALRDDLDAATVVSRVSHPGLVQHLSGIETLRYLPAWPDDRLVAEVATSYAETMAQFDDPEEKDVRKFG
jgi:hypothetical protein